VGGVRGKGRPGLDSERSCAVSTCGRRQRATFHQRHRRLLHRTGPEPPIHQPAHHHHHHDNNNNNKLCARPPQYAPAPCKLTFDLLTLKVVSKSRVTSATSVPIFTARCYAIARSLLWPGVRLSVRHVGVLYTDG